MHVRCTPHRHFDVCTWLSNGNAFVLNMNKNGWSRCKFSAPCNTISTNVSVLLNWIPVLKCFHFIALFATKDGQKLFLESTQEEGKGGANAVHRSPANVSWYFTKARESKVDCHVAKWNSVALPYYSAWHRAVKTSCHEAFITENRVSNMLLWELNIKNLQSSVKTDMKHKYQKNRTATLRTINSQRQKECSVKTIIHTKQLSEKTLLSLAGWCRAICSDSFLTSFILAQVPKTIHLSTIELTWCSF